MESVESILEKISTILRQKTARFQRTLYGAHLQRERNQNFPQMCVCSWKSTFFSKAEPMRVYSSTS